MQPTFGLQREQTNDLFFSTYKNVSGKFHFHSHIEVFIVDEGEVDVFINDKSRRLKAGEMSVALSYDAHTYHSAGTSLSSLLIIPPHMCEDFTALVKNKQISDPFIDDSSAVSSVRLCFEKLKNSPNNLISRGYASVILGILFEHISLTPAKRDIDNELSAKLLIYINENFKNDISLSEIAAKFGYNPSYISRYFKNCFNIGLNHYIKVIRLKNAVLLMQENKHNITYCALESGFNSMCTFYRAFFEEFGCTPKDYLK